MTAFSVAVVECIDNAAWLWSVFLSSLGWPVLALTAYIHNYGLAWAF